MAGPEARHSMLFSLFSSSLFMAAFSLSVILILILSLLRPRTCAFPFSQFLASFEVFLKFSCTYSLRSGSAIFLHRVVSHSSESATRVSAFFLILVLLVSLVLFFRAFLPKIDWCFIPPTHAGLSRFYLLVHHIMYTE